MQCPECQSTHIRKNGHGRGKQNYICISCNRQFIDIKPATEYPTLGSGFDCAQPTWFLSIERSRSTALLETTIARLIVTLLLKATATILSSNAYASMSTAWVSEGLNG